MQHLWLADEYFLIVFFDEGLLLRLVATTEYGWQMGDHPLFFSGSDPTTEFKGVSLSPLLSHLLHCPRSIPNRYFSGSLFRSFSTRWTPATLQSFWSNIAPPPRFCIFWGARVCWPLLCLCRPFGTLERCLDSNPESCRSKQATNLVQTPKHRHPSPFIAIHLSNLATHLPS